MYSEEKFAFLLFTGLSLQHEQHDFDQQALVAYRGTFPGCVTVLLVVNHIDKARWTQRALFVLRVF